MKQLFVPVAAILLFGSYSAHALRLTFDMPLTLQQDMSILSTNANYPRVYGDDVSAFTEVHAGKVYNYGPEGGITDQIDMNYNGVFYRNGFYAGFFQAGSFFSIVNHHVFFNTSSDTNVSLKLQNVQVGILASDTLGRSSTSRLFVAVFTNGTTEAWKTFTPVFGTNSFMHTFDFTMPDDTGRTLGNLKGDSRLYFVIPGVGAPNHSYAIDNLTFTQIPEPSMLTFATLGSLLLLARSRRVH